MIHPNLFRKWDMTCHQCGRKIKTYQKPCPHCGWKLKKEAAK